MKSSWLAAGAVVCALLAESGAAHADCVAVDEGENASITGKYFKIKMSDNDFEGFSREDNGSTALADPSTWFDSGHFLRARIDYRVRNGNCFVGVSHITSVISDLDGTKHTGCEDSDWGYQKFRYSVKDNRYSIIGWAISEVAADVAKKALESDDWVASSWTVFYDFDVRYNLTGLKKNYDVTAKTRLSVRKDAGKELTTGYKWDVNTVCM